MGQKSEFICTPSGRIHIVRFFADGERQVIPQRKFLLVHGNPGAAFHWDLIGPLLALSGEVVALDLPGFGESRPQPLDTMEVSLPRLAQAVVEIADCLGWRERFTVVGHSHGGGVAQVLAATFPERLNAAVFLATLAFPTQISYRILPLPGMRAFLKLYAHFMGHPGWMWLKHEIVHFNVSAVSKPDKPYPWFVDKELENMVQSPEMFVSMVEVAYHEPCFLLQSLAPQNRIRTLMVHGDADVVIPLDYAKNVCSTITRAGGSCELKILHDAGHMIILYQHEQCVGFIEEFMRTGEKADLPAAEAHG
jgi:pimeloyl-ACP methyl ester carboxylesterase